MNDQTDIQTQPTAPSTLSTPVMPTPEPISPVQTQTGGKKFNLKKTLIISGIVIGMIILLALVSLIFRDKKPLVTLPDATAMPTTPLVLTEESKINDSKIKTEKDEIMQIDIYQKYLTPPQLKFDISF